MTKTELIDKLRSIIQDVKDTGMVFSPTSDVPNVDTTKELTYENGAIKKGQIIKTCVLYVDIRNSVQLNEEHRATIMGKIYTAFTKVVLIIAREEGGMVRNIIGDRVMIVFPEENCYTKAVNCAISINHAASIINRAFPDVDFACGIGIDYGKMSVIKVGIDRRDDEKEENKNLVWIGYPANYASRLTDSANKTITEKQYAVRGTIRSFFLNHTYVDSKTSKLYSEQEFICKMNINGGRFTIDNFVSVDSVEAKDKEKKYAPIMMSEAVYNGFVASNPNRQSVKKGLWKLQPNGIRDIDYNVYGGDVIWTI